MVLGGEPPPFGNEAGSALKLNADGEDDALVARVLGPVTGGFEVNTSTR